MMRITLPWPSPKLSPNARVHWAELSRAKKSYREWCHWHAVQQGMHKIDADRLSVSLTFYPPDRRARDIDNMLASIKAGLDGLVDVLGVDDSKWTMTIAKADEIGGFIEVLIE